MMHFVGFKGDEYHRATRVFGAPDFVHRHNDHRIAGTLSPGDVVVFANGAQNTVKPVAFNDSAHF